MVSTDYPPTARVADRGLLVFEFGKQKELKVSEFLLMLSNPLQDHSSLIHQVLLFSIPTRKPDTPIPDVQQVITARDWDRRRDEQNGRR